MMIPQKITFNKNNFNFIHENYPIKLRHTPLFLKKQWYLRSYDRWVKLKENDIIKLNILTGEFRIERKNNEYTYNFSRSIHEY